MKMKVYSASRGNETPGIRFEAKTLTAAKAKASRELEAGAFAGQQIRLRELMEVNGEIIPTDSLWVKVAHGGNWKPMGDAK